MMHVDGPIVAPAGQYWRSEMLPTDPYAFYHFTFTAKTARQGYWVVFPFDAAGNEMRADTHSAVYPSATWTAQGTYFRGLPGAVGVQVGFRGLNDAPIEVRDIRVTPAPAAEVRAWARGIGTALPYVQWEARSDRHQLIPRTMDRLRHGETIRVVMLGDSISQDTCMSYYDLFAEELYPGSDLQLVPSIDGSKGCWYYLDDARYQRYVVDQKPELLMVGTASEHEGIGPVETFLKRARATLDCDIMVVSGPMGLDQRYPAEDTGKLAVQAREAIPRRRAFAAEQAALCARLGVEYLNLCDAWIDYLDGCGLPHHYLYRDACHADDRGKQILAQLMTRYWQPVGA